MKYMPILPLICTLCYLPMSLQAGGVYLDDQYRFGQVNIFKVSPAFYGDFVPKGGMLSYETGSGIEKWSINFSAKYLMAVDSSDTRRAIQEHLKFEVQWRYWVTDYFKSLYFTPLVDVYSTGDIAGGALFGFQFFFGDHLVVDTYAGLQSATPVEDVEFSLLLRFGLHFGIALY